MYTNNLKAEARILATSLSAFLCFQLFCFQENLKESFGISKHFWYFQVEFHFDAQIVLQSKDGGSEEKETSAKSTGSELIPLKALEGQQTQPSFSMKKSLMCLQGDI